MAARGRQRSRFRNESSQEWTEAPAGDDPAPPDATAGADPQGQAASLRSGTGLCLARAAGHRDRSSSIAGRSRASRRNWRRTCWRSSRCSRPGCRVKEGKTPFGFPRFRKRGQHRSGGTALPSAKSRNLLPGELGVDGHRLRLEKAPGRILMRQALRFTEWVVAFRDFVSFWGGKFFAAVLVDGVARRAAPRTAISVAPSRDARSKRRRRGSRADLPVLPSHLRSVAGVLPIIAAASPILTNLRSIFNILKQIKIDYKELLLTLR